MGIFLGGGNGVLDEQQPVMELRAEVPVVGGVLIDPPVVQGIFVLGPEVQGLLVGGDGKAISLHGVGLGRDGQGGNGQDDGGQGAAQGSFHPFRFLSLQITGCYFWGEGLSPRRPE